MQSPISFENEGQKLFGMIHTPDTPGPWPGVVFFHGFTGHRFEAHCIFVKTARELARQGIASMRFDFRGSGESEGLFEEMSVQSEISDGKKALDFLANYPGIDVSRIGMLGFSLGGQVAINVGPMDKRVKSMVLWAPAASFPVRFCEDLKKTTPDEKGRYDVGGNPVGPEFIAGAGDLKPFELIRRFTGSLLIIHGTNDQTVPVSDSERLLTEATCKEKVLELIEGSDHGWSSSIYEHAVMTRSVEWLKRML